MVPVLPFSIVYVAVALALAAVLVALANRPAPPNQGNPVLTRWVHLLAQIGGLTFFILVIVLIVRALLAKG